MPLTSFGLFRIGNDAELRYTSSGTAVCNVSLAYNFGQTDENNNRKTEWINAVVWGERAEKLQPYFKKGVRIMAQVHDLHIDRYTDRDNKPASKLVGDLGQVEFADSKPASQDAANDDASGGSDKSDQAPDNKTTPKPQGKRKSGALMPATTPPDDPDNFDNDIPL